MFAKGNRLAVGVQHHNPRKRMCTQALISQLNEACTEKGFKSKSQLGAIIERLIKNALEGDTAAIRDIFDRVEGKTPQPLSIGDDDGDVEFTISIGRRDADGSESAASLHVRKTVDVSEAD